MSAQVQLESLMEALQAPPPLLQVPTP
eukprot:SAG25_NODE_14071_length_259_cov_0.900000_1_plen_26_part_01